MRLIDESALELPQSLGSLARSYIVNNRGKRAACGGKSAAALVFERVGKSLLKQFWQLGDVSRNPTAFVPGQHIGDLGVLLIVSALDIAKI